MDQIDLQKRVSLHNCGQIAKGLLLVPGSLALWIASFWTVRIRLDRLRLIWVDIESGETRIRYPAGMD